MEKTLEETKCDLIAEMKAIITPVVIHLTPFPDLQNRVDKLYRAFEELQSKVSGIRTILKYRDLTQADIRNAVCFVFQITPEQLRSSDRATHLADARFIYSYEMRRNFNMFFRAIGLTIRRDHSTVMYHIEQYEALITCNSEFKARALQVKERIRELTIETN